MSWYPYFTDERTAHDANGLVCHVPEVLQSLATTKLDAGFFL